MARYSLRILLRLFLSSLTIYLIFLVFCWSQVLRSSVGDYRADNCRVYLSRPGEACRQLSLKFLSSHSIALALTWFMSPARFRIIWSLRTRTLLLVGKLRYRIWFFPFRSGRVLFAKRSAWSKFALPSCHPVHLTNPLEPPAISGSLSTVNQDVYHPQRLRSSPSSCLSRFRVVRCQRGDKRIALPCGEVVLILSLFQH